MIAIGNMLAAKDSDNIGRIIGVAIVIGIAGINAIVAAVKKRQERRHREQVRSQIDPPVRKRPVPLPDVSRPRFQTREEAFATSLSKRDDRKRMAKRAEPAQRFQRAAKRSATKQPPAPTLARTAEVQAPVQRVTAIEPATAKSKSASVDARALSRWLTPATMRQQFILTEILQPPLSLRDRVL